MTSVPEFNCIFCKETFDDKESLQIHFRKHGDPKFNQKRFVLTQNDTKMSNERSRDKVEMVSCDVCPEVFTTISKAITHKHKVHPDHDAKYFCPWCGKLFTMKHLYNKHIQANHDGVDNSDEKFFHCDTCNVDFFVPTAMLYHNKFFHRQDTDLPSLGVSKKLKLYNQEAVQIYYCAFCGEEYENKVNLHKHIGDDHGDENQSPDEVLRCPLCEAIFYHLDAYEIHLTFHSSEDLYNDKNEMRNEITEFALETVAPITERVENIEPKDAETSMNAMGIDQFLQLAMDESDDSTPKKTKKKKKHKKSKNHAITLDEFLNMNKDVFGEEIDFQGVEEVPTQVVAKRLKVNKQPANIKNTSKFITQTNLEKLKQQGIVVKKKSGVNFTKSQDMNVGKQLLSHSPQLSQKNVLNITKSVPECSKESNMLSTSNEMLSKLINQSNNQIKIVKKVSQDKNIPESQQEKSVLSPEASNIEQTEMMNCSTTKIANHEENNSEIKHPEEFVENQPLCDDTEIVSQENEKTMIAESSIEQNDEEQDNEENVCNVTSVTTKETIDSLPNSKQEPEMNSTIINTNNTAPKSILPLSTDKQKSNFDDKEKNNHESDSDDVEQNVMVNTKSKIPDQNTDSLSALKHLSHLITVKPVLKKVNDIKDDNFTSNITNDVKAYSELNGSFSNETEVLQMNQYSPKNTSTKTNDSFTNINKNFTIKSLTRSPQSCTIEDRSEDNNVDEDTEKDINEKNQLIMKKMGVNIKTEPVDHCINTNNSLKLPSNMKSKPVNFAKNVTKRIIEKSSQSMDIKYNVKNINSQRYIKSKEIHEDIEIFNIEDSDSDDNKELNKIEKTPDNSTNTHKSEISAVHPIDVLKHLGNNITVKNMNQQSSRFNQYSEVNAPPESAQSDESNDTDHIPKELNLKGNLQSPQNQKNLAIKHVLKNLGKNITVKSRNPSPSQSVTSQDHNTQDSNNEKQDDSDSDTNVSTSCTNRVKITAIENNDGSDTDNDMDSEQHNESDLNTQRQNVVIQSPDDSCSDNDMENIGQDSPDLEKQIKLNRLAKPPQNMFVSKNATYLNSLKNKDITIKSLNDNTQKNLMTEREDLNGTDNQDNLLNATPNKHAKLQNKSALANRNQNFRQTGVKKSSNCQSNVAASNQVNTINKEVTVKTFQTQTVIEEITTTVTKTIRTVNQSMKQEIQNKSSSTSVGKPRIQGIRPSYQPPQLLQSTSVRHITPTIGSKIRNVAPTIRPGAIVRASNQIVSVRPGLTLRPNTPRMQVINTPRTQVTNTPRPSTSGHQKPVIGKALKISPQAVTTSLNKRPRPEEAAGHFSCFKKPKESLIPVSDILTFNSNEGNTNSHVETASHMSKSNVTTTKIVKGNSVVTSMQTKSEVCTSSQQLNKLGSVSGLKVMKTSQVKQTDEKYEKSSTNQSTLEAIQKLQKQGLLVKKPRLDIDENSEHSEPHDDDNEGYCSADENED